MNIKESRKYTQKEWEELQSKNYEATIKISNFLGKLKGFTTAYSNPRSGKILLNYEGQSFQVDLMPIPCEKDECFADVCARHKHWFNEQATQFREDDHND